MKSLITVILRDHTNRNSPILTEKLIISTLELKNKTKTHNFFDMVKNL